MTRQKVLRQIEVVRQRQDALWGKEFDDKNTVNDWITYITAYAGKAYTIPFDKATFRKNILDVAALAVAILERDSYAPRHFDETK